MNGPLTAPGPGRAPAVDAQDGEVRRARASSPGKLILMGEHSVVYGQPAVAAAVQRRLLVTAAPLGRATPTHEASSLSTPAVVLKLGDREPVTVSWQRSLEAAAATDAGGERNREGAAYLTLVALGEAARLLGRTPPAMAVTVASDVPVGHGMGSSAALALSVIAAVCRASGENPEPAELERAAHEVERRQHGAPSGMDAATVRLGGVVRAERSGGPATPLRFRPLAVPAEALARFRAFDSGCPDHDTGEVVAAVRRRIETDPGLEAVVEEMGALARTFADMLASDRDPTAVAGVIRRFEAALERLGVVPPSMARLIRRIEAEGGAAKVSGAGGLCDARDGRPGAGMILIHHEDPRRIARWDFLAPLTPVNAPFGGPGLEAS